MMITFVKFLHIQIKFDVFWIVFKATGEFKKK